MQVCTDSRENQPHASPAHAPPGWVVPETHASGGQGGVRQAQRHRRCGARQVDRSGDPSAASFGRTEGTAPRSWLAPSDRPTACQRRRRRTAGSSRYRLAQEIVAASAAASESSLSYPSHFRAALSSHGPVRRSHSATADQFGTVSRSAHHPYEPPTSRHAAASNRARREPALTGVKPGVNPASFPSRS